MIRHLSIRDFAIIENAEIDFQDGLNIITGETGAGKSIVIEAVSLALGSRADLRLRQKYLQDKRRDRDPDPSERPVQEAGRYPRPV